MAGEISLGITLNVTKDTYSRNWSESGTYDLAAQIEASGIETTSTTKKALPVGDVATLGLLMVKNLDATDAIDIGLDSTGTFVPFATVSPKEIAIFRLKAGITVQVKASANVPKLQYWLLSN